MRGTWLVGFILLGEAYGGAESRARAGKNAPPAAAATVTATTTPTPTTTTTGPAAEPTTFESLLGSANAAADMATLLAPFADNCNSEKRELDRVRCRTTHAYLRRMIPHRSYWTIVDDPQVIAVSDFDAAIKGYHLSVAGCLACTHPVTLGRLKEGRLLTLKAPDKEAESLRAAVEISRNSVGFDSLGEAKSWLAHSRPELRTQFVFQPGETEWTFGTSRGYAMTLLGLRVFNRCTGEVLISRPPSTGLADMPGIDDGCREDDRDGDGRPSGVRTADDGAQLSKEDVSRAMGAIRPEAFACFQKFKVSGRADLNFVVAGNGSVSAVRVSGAFSGTPTGLCLIEAAERARFPPSAHEQQRFSYPFFLRP
jgi:hypothetical protein